MTQRTRACILPGLVIALLAADFASGQNEVQSEFFGTSDGSRFLIVPTGKSDLIHWAVAIPAGELIDPAEHPGLSFAIARATLSGSDTIGTTNWVEEQKAQLGLDAAMRELQLGLGRGEPPSEELQRKIPQLTGRLERFRQPDEWERQVRAAPSTRFEIQEHEHAVVTSVTTTRGGLPIVARLFMDRRENSVLRDLALRYKDILTEREQAATTDSDRVRREMIDLAYFGTRTRLATLQPLVDSKIANDLYRKIFAPSASFNVITGGFELAEMKQYIQRQFTKTACPVWTPPKRDVRRGSRVRISTLTGERRGIAVGLQADVPISMDQLRILGEWLSGGSSSYLARMFAKSGVIGAQCRTAAPFPLGSNPGLLLAEVWTSPDPRLASTADLLEILRSALARAPIQITFQDVKSAHGRAIGARDRERCDPYSLALWLALECGMHGRSTEAALDTSSVKIDHPTFKAFAEQILADGKRTIVSVEAVE